MLFVFFLFCLSSLSYGAAVHHTFVKCIDPDLINIEVYDVSSGMTRYKDSRQLSEDEKLQVKNLQVIKYYELKKTIEQLSQKEEEAFILCCDIYTRYKKRAYN